MTFIFSLPLANFFRQKSLCLHLACKARISIYAGVAQLFRALLAAKEVESWSLFARTTILIFDVRKHIFCCTRGRDNYHQGLTMNEISQSASKNLIPQSITTLATVLPPKKHQATQPFQREELTLKSNFFTLNSASSPRKSRNTPKGIIQLVHAAAEHRERYHDFGGFPRWLVTVLQSSMTMWARRHKLEF